MSNAVSGVVNMHESMLLIRVPISLESLHQGETEEFNKEFDRYQSVIEDQLATLGSSIPRVYVPDNSDCGSEKFAIEVIPLVKSFALGSDEDSHSGETE